jgi:hypothetical protein
MIVPRQVLACIAGISALLVVSAANAMVVTAQLDHVNNGTIITQPSQIIDVTADDSLGAPWTVTVGGGLNFEEFFFNYSQPLTAAQVMLTGSSDGSWAADTNGATASNFGHFSFHWIGPVSGGLSDLTFQILAAGDFVPNSDERIFAAKIASEQSGNAGGFVSTDAVSAVPLPPAGWLFVAATLALLGWFRAGRRLPRAA